MFKEKPILNELYVRERLDPKFEYNKFEYYDEFEAIISKVKFLMSIEQGEALGHPELGINYDKVLFGGKDKVDELKNDIYMQISYFIPEINQYKLEVTHELGSDGYKDYLFININVNDIPVIQVVT